MPEPVRILYVHHRSERSGASGALAGLVSRLDRTRFEPHVFCAAGGAAHQLREAGATVHTGSVAAFTHIWASTYHGRRWLLLVRELAWLAPHLAGLRRTLRRGHFALVHLNDSPLVPAAWLARRAGLPVVWHLRSALPEDDGSRRSVLLRRAIRTLSTRTVAINDDVATSFDVGAAVVPDPVDLDRFRPAERRRSKAELGLDEERPLVCFFGYLYPAKGFREFIGAAARTRDVGVEATWLLVGGGVRDRDFFRRARGRALLRLGLTRDYEHEARELVASLGLADVVRLVPYGDTAPYFHAADVVVVPSQGPEVGLPAIEAGAAGVPVVATGTRTGGGVLVPGETGIVADGRDAGSIACAVVELLRDPERARSLGAAGRAHVERRFDAARAVRGLEAIYVDALGRAGP